MEVMETNNSSEHRLISFRRNRMNGWPVAIFFIGLGVTTVLFFSIYNAEQVKTQSDFEHVTQVRVDSLYKEIAELDDSVQAIQHFINRDPTDRNLSHDLSLFIKQLLNDETHVRAVAWVLPNFSDGYEAGQSGTRIPAAGTCDAPGNIATLQAFRLCSLATFEHGPALLTNSLLNKPELVTALAQALQTGKMVVSRPAAAAQQLTAEQKQHRYFVFPVNQTQHGELKVEAGTVIPQGFLVVEDYIPGLVEMGLELYTESEGGVDIYLLDSSADANSQLLHYHPSRLREKSLQQSAVQIPKVNDPLVRAITLRIGGRNWQLILAGVPAVFSPLPSTVSIAVMFAGIIISLLLAVFLTSIYDKKQFAEQQVARRTRELAEINSALAQEMVNRQDIEAGIKYDLQVKQTFNAVLETAMTRCSINEKLERILHLVLDAEWVSIDTRGSVFLADEAQERLTLVVQHGLADPLLAACANISFGQCLCGKAAATQEIVFSCCLDHQHEITYTGMDQHGHYCIPILSGEVTLGVLNLYVEHNHQTNEAEKHNLMMIANILSGLIEHERIEVLVKKTLKDLDNLVNALNEHAIVSVLDNLQKIVSINYRYCKRSGYAVEDLIDGHFCHPLIDDQTEDFIVNLTNMISRGKVWKGELCNRDKNNQPYWTVTTIVPFQNENEIYKYVVISADITERKIAEKKLADNHIEIQHAYRELNSQKQALDEHAIVSITDNHGVITYANDKFIEISQYSRKELIGKTHKVINSGVHGKEIFQDMWQTISQGQVWKGEVCNKKKDGTYYWVTATIVPFLDDKGIPYKYIALRVDITRQKENEQQLIARNNEIEKAHKELEKSQNMMLHAEKLASVGQLAAGIAHEINTPVQFVGDNTRFLQESFDDLIGLIQAYEELGNAANEDNVFPELVNKARALSEAVEVDYLAVEVPKAINQSLEGIERISNIVRSMKDFSHPGTASLENIDLNKAIESTINVSRNEWKYVAEMVTELDATLPLVPCFLGELNQVILNMIVNATHAINDNRNGTDPLGKITISTLLVNNDVEIRITDSGCGMPEEVRKRIFEPFYTTKGVGKGTGQGLAIAYAVIVGKHKGTISVDSEVSKGTTFVIRLPMKATVETSDMDMSEELINRTGVM